MPNLGKEQKKALIAEYKRTPKEMGVYEIRNKVNGKRYIASSRDIQARFNRHRMNLKMGSEPVVGLQAEWTSFGADAFVFAILEQLEPLNTPGYQPAEDLQFLESVWIDKLQPFEEKGYNIKK